MHFNAWLFSAEAWQRLIHARSIEVVLEKQAMISLRQADIPRGAVAERSVRLMPAAFFWFYRQFSERNGVAMVTIVGLSYI